MDVLEREESASGVLTLRLNRPERKNALDLALAGELTRALEAAEESRSVRCVVVTGAGDAFCSGGDLTGGSATGHALATMREISKPALALHQLSKPSIARVNGVAAGAGWNLALGCDLVVAAHSARFCQIFARRALSLDLGGAWLLPRLVGLHRAKQLALLADWISADEASELGLVNRVVPAVDLEPTTRALAEKIAAGPPAVLRMAKHMVNRAANSDLAAALDLEAFSQGLAIASEDHQEGLRAFFDKRPPVFTGR